MRSLPLLLLVLTACEKEEPEKVETPPKGELALEYPAAGEWADAGATTARGTVENVESVTVSGAEAEVEGPRFTAPITLVRGVNVVEAVAVDAREDTLFARHGVLAGDFASPDGDVEHAVLLRVNQGALDKAGELAAGYLDPATLNASLAAVNPVYEDELLGFVDVRADVTGVSFGTPTVAIVPAGGKLSLVATLPDVHVDAVAYADTFGYEFDSAVAVWADEAVVTGSLGVSADGRLAVQLDDAAIELVEFGYSTDLLPSWVTDYLLVETLRDTLEEKIVEQIDALVPPLLEETLAGLDPSFSTEVLGAPVDLAFSFADAEVDADGIVLALDLDVSIPEVTDHPSVGYLTAAYGEPDVDTRADLAAAISDDLLNRLLFEAWAGGVLALTMSTDDGSLEPLLLAALKAEEGTVQVDAVLPPVIVERDGGLLAQVGELMITVDTPGGELGEHIVIALAGDIPLEVVVEDGELVLELGDPTLVFEVRESDWGASDETVTRLIEDMLPLDTLLLLLGDFAFPLPSLYGFAVDSGTAARDDDGVHTGLEVWLQ